MFASLAIVFREGFEMVLVITILLAATRQVASANRWIISGGVLGVALSLMLAVAALSSETIHMLLKAKLTSALILILASILIAWTVIWMKSEGKRLSQKLSNIDLSNAKYPLLSLAVVAMLTVVREGSEVVLFLLGLVSQNDTSTQDILLGSSLGAIGALLTGVFMYLGLIRVNIGKVFDLFAVFMTFLSAGMAINAVSKLTAIGKLPALIEQVWDTTPYFDHHSNWLALVMHVLLGYTEKPSLMQILVYLAVLVGIYAMTKSVNRKLSQA